ncbi:Eaa protein [Salmonella enterica]|nr:Eaa protein [Salmonella enterica]
MTTITRERLLKIQQWRETYGTGSNVMLPAEEAEELARIALAALDSEPVGEVSEKRYGLVMDGTVDLGGESTYRIIKGEKVIKRLPLGTKFYIAPPAPVVPDGLRQALSNAGIAAPESDEMLAATCEKYIQMLVTWVKDRKPFQPAPVMPEDISGIIERFQYQADHLSDWHHIDEHSCKVNRRDLMTALEFMDSCRAAMLNGGKS